MSEKQLFSSAEMDAIKEISNIGMGMAAADLSDILEKHVHLHVPEVKVVGKNELAQIHSKRDVISICRQAFGGSIINGEVITVFQRESYKILVETYGYDVHEVEQTEKCHELILEIASTLAAACLTGIATQLQAEVHFSAPQVVCLEKETSVFTELFDQRNANWGRAILTKISFLIEDEDFSAEMLVFIPESSLTELQRKVKAILDEL
ncbi:MAG: chemotaxis protein CheC [Candidatus Thiodiazotropha sp. (ex Lucinoma kastoroae)]|nr:chemotaxis protein CheC [Candidatus Thiodiazotropha sp. (ex Lucinoma kastoroae)]MCU7860732.1 chemotaxis protein CheC [Candidatus Thiodiazotropha sp. (ex Lucinoma kastoroae)]